MTEKAIPRRLRGSMSSKEILVAARTSATSGKPLSIREVAKVLGCSAMAIYKYFPGRAELVAALADGELANIKWSSGESWQGDLQNLALLHSEFLDARPWLLPLLFENPAPGPAAMKLGEKYLEIIAKSRLSPSDSASAFTGLLALIYGRGAFTAGRETKKLETGGLELPHTEASWKELTSYDASINFENILDMFISGIEARTLKNFPTTK